MEPDDKGLYDLVKENNALLKKMNRREQIKKAYSLVKYAVIAVLLIWSYLQIKPYFDKVLELYNNVNDTSTTVKDFGDGFNLDSLKELFQ